MTVVLEARQLSKRYGRVQANQAIDFTVRSGEIHVLLGENGAGKTTLMNLLYGLERPDSGEIRVDGQPIILASPRDAIHHGIVMVHQHFMLVPVFTVLENVVLGVEETRKRSNWLGELGRLETVKPERRIRDLADQLSLNLDLNAKVADLSVGIQQKIEIIKALYRGARILILDEPTAVLTPAETEELFDLLRKLTRQGLSIVMITHKLKEALAIADRISVMRQGQMVGTVNPATATEAQLAELMVGRKVILQIDKPPFQPGEPIVSAQNLRVLDDRKHVAVNDVSLTIRAGEILGIAGVQGNGQTELSEALAGLRSVESGQITFLGQDVTRATPRTLIDRGLAHVPEDRGKNGIVKPYSLADNIALCTYYKPPFAKGFQLREGAIVRQTTRLIEEFDIRPANPDYPAGSLSGGNQQKLIMARELSRDAKFLIACQPTRGVDIGAIELIHRRIIEARSQGMAVLLISSELDEVLALSDRVAVMFQGRMIETLPIEQASRDRVGQLMGGSTVS
ncbi:ABC transporter ATP-binding protein [Leptolyngbya ohadii]|uniref:ABC transporter ATP-binding protein n=1 Tax=Leptolyngbya ohadii TaxID=1962290 RepID=UPI000B59C419|nr:ABC transporter ATP-binding protein [Leptolyngbya ohadii]